MLMSHMTTLKKTPLAEVARRGARLMNVLLDATESDEAKNVYGADTVQTFESVIDSLHVMVNSIDFAEEKRQGGGGTPAFLMSKREVEEEFQQFAVGIEELMDMVSACVSGG